MFWLVVFLLTTCLVVPENGQILPVQELVCKQKRSESGLWWDRFFTGTGGCEVLDLTKEECGVCGLTSYVDRADNLCRHYELLWKFNYFTIHRTPKNQQFCLMMDHCRMSLAIKRAQERQEREGEKKTNFVNYICGTETQGRREQRGECESVYGTYICVCIPPYQGRDCNVRGGPDGGYARGVQALLDTKVRVSDPMTILIAVRHKGHNLKVHIHLIQWNASLTITEPVLNEVSSTKLIKHCEVVSGLSLNDEQCEQYLRGSTTLYSISLRFPLKRDNRYVWYYREGIVYPIGYYTNFTVTTTNTINGEEKESFSRTNYDKVYNVFIQYPTDIGCYVNTRIVNCQELQEKVNVYDASESIVLHGDTPTFYIHEIHKLPCTSNEDETIKWTISRVESDGTFDYIYEHKSTNKFEFVIKPYSFTNGMHVAEFSYTKLSLGTPRENFDLCFFTVVEAPPIAIIDGGRSRYVDVDSEIVLDGSRSYDPNFPVKRSKIGLQFQWSCIINKTKEPCLESYLSPSQGSHNYIELPPSVLQVQQVYIINLTVTKAGKKPAHASQNLLTGNIGNIQSIGLVCVNCLEGDIANPTDFVYLLVQVVYKPDSIVESQLNFTWTFSTHPEYPPVTSTESIRVSQTSQDLLKIDRNKLQHNNKYSFRAAVQENKEFAYSEIDILTPTLNSFTCSLAPESGLVAVTNFSLSCTNISDITYEVYDKSVSDLNYFSGRMMFTGLGNPHDNSFRLANKKVVVYGYSRFKVTQEWVHEVSLAPFNGSLTETNDMLHQLEHLKMFPQKLLHSTSIIASTLKPETDWSSTSLLKRLISTLGTYTGEEDLAQMRLIKLTLSSLEFILVEIYKNGNKTLFGLEVEEAKMCASLTSALARNLFQKVKVFDDETTLTETILHQMVESLLNVIEIVLTVKNAASLSRPLHLVKPDVMHLVKDTTYELVDALYKMSSSLLWRQVQGDSAKEIVSSRSNITEWVMVNSPKVLYHLKKQNPSLPINFSVGFYQVMKKLDVFGIQVTNLNVNPFWWAGGDINTNILLVETCIKVNLTQCRPQRTYYKAPIFLYFNISHVYSSIAPQQVHTKYLDLTKSAQDIDLDITVYRFDPPLRAKLFVGFEFENTTEDYRVMFSVNERPGFESMQERGVTINNKNQSSVKYLRYNKDDNDKLYYMGIYPVQAGSAGEKVKFKLTIAYAVCKTWLSWKWGRQRCWVGEPETNEMTLRCDCSHLSMFAGSVQVPYYKINPAIEFTLFLTEEFNWLPLIVFVVILLVSVILYVWACREDRQDLSRGIVTVLEDNYPGDRFAYLLGVYTGSRINASTDANVGIKIFGRNGTTRAHILRNNNRPMLRGNCDDWFLVYSLDHLGTLEKLHLWHDNSGESPDWFVEKIEVYDLTDRLQYIFDFNIWLELGVHEFPETVVATSSIEEYYSIRRVFISNVLAGLKDSNYWTSVFCKHARHPVKRVHRITVVLCYVMVAVICSILVYHFNKGEGYEEDYSLYDLDLTDLIIFGITLFAASFPACLEMFLFRKSFTYKYERMQSSLFLRPEVASIKKVTFFSKNTENVSPVSVSPVSSKFSRLSLFDSSRTRFIELSRSNVDRTYIAFGLRGSMAKERGVYERFADVIHTLVRSGTLEPVRLSRYRSTKNLHKMFYITAWILVVVLVLAATAVVVLYGHRIPKVEGEKWVTILLCVFLFDAFVLSTLKILFCSIILSFVFQRVVPVSNYRIKPEDGRKKNLVDDIDLLNDLVYIRSHQMYCPLKGKLKEMNRLKCVRRQQWKTLIEFCIIILLISVLVMLSSLYIDSVYISNAHAAWMLTRGPSYKHELFSSIYNTTHYENFLVSDLTDKLHKSAWYNQDDLSGDGVQVGRSWTWDCTTRLLGMARIRQLRVILGACPQVDHLEDIDEICSPPWSLAAEDTGTYHSRWYIGGHEDATRKSNAWRYTNADFSNSSASYGTTLTVYPAGGFIEELGSVRDDMEYALSSLIPQNWLNHLTRAVFIEATLYNVNTRLFTQVIIVAEQMPTGEYLLDVKAESVNADFSFKIWQCYTFCTFMVLLLLRLCILINRRGLFVYFSKTIDVYETFTVALVLLTFVFYNLHKTSSSQYLQEFSGNGMEEFFNFSNFFYIFWTKTVVLVLIVCVVIRMFYSFRFGRIFFSFYYTFLLSTSLIVWLVLFLVLYLVVARRLVGYFLNVFVFPYHTSILLYYKSPYAGGRGKNNVLVCFMSSISCLVTLLFITSFVYYYKLGKIYKLLETDKLNYVTFLKEIIQDALSKVCKIYTIYKQTSIKSN